jgi:hypothetical protein
VGALAEGGPATIEGSVPIKNAPVRDDCGIGAENKKKQ